MKLNTSHNELANLLEPRHIKGWRGGVFTLWDRRVHIHCDANMAYEHSLEEIEDAYWNNCFVQMEEKLKRQGTKQLQSWLADGRFFRNIMAPIQMELYLPSFFQIVKLMPRQMLKGRRKILTRYLNIDRYEGGGYQVRWARWFVRSAPLLYPAYELVSRADQFVSVLDANKDQRTSAQRMRLIQHIKRISRMTDAEVISLYAHQDSYERELEWLLVLSRDFKLTLQDIYSG